MSGPWMPGQPAHVNDILLRSGPLLHVRSPSLGCELGSRHGVASSQLPPQNMAECPAIARLFWRKRTFRTEATASFRASGAKGDRNKTEGVSPLFCVRGLVPYRGCAPQAAPRRRFLLPCAAPSAFVILGVQPLGASFDFQLLDLDLRCGGMIGSVHGACCGGCDPPRGGYLTVRGARLACGWRVDSGALAFTKRVPSGRLPLSRPSIRSSFHELRWGRSNSDPKTHGAAQP